MILKFAYKILIISCSVLFNSLVCVLINISFRTFLFVLEQCLSENMYEILVTLFKIMTIFET